MAAAPIVERTKSAAELVMASSRLLRNQGSLQLRMTPEKAKPSIVREITRKAEVFKSFADTIRETKSCTNNVTKAGRNARASARDFWLKRIHHSCAREGLCLAPYSWNWAS